MSLDSLLIRRVFFDDTGLQDGELTAAGRYSSTGKFDPRAILALMLALGMKWISGGLIMIPTTKGIYVTGGWIGKVEEAEEMR